MSLQSLFTHGGAGRRSVVSAALLGLVAAPLALGVSAPAQANPTGTALVISEVYGAGGNSGAMFNADYVELYNPTDAPVTLTDAYWLQYRSSAGTANANGVAALTGSVPANGYYLVATSPTTDPDGAALPSDPDITVTGVSMAAANGTIYLATTATALNLSRPFTGNAQVVDLVGFGSTNTYEGGSPTPAISTTLAASRNDAADDSDVNGTDFTVGTPAPRNSSYGTVPLVLEATDPADVTVDEGAPMSDITLEAAGGTAPYSWAFTGLPAGVTETSDGVIGGTPTAGGVFTVTATVTDSATPTAGTDSVEFTITVEGAVPVISIAEIQGAGNTSTMQGTRVRTQGVVTGSYPGSAGLSGFFMQTAGAEGVDYVTPSASDGIFVFTGTRTTPAVGDSVAVTGVVGENFGLPRLVTTRDSQIVDIPALAPVVPKAQLPAADCAQGACLTGDELAAAREDHESESFLPTAPYTVTDSYDGGATSSSNFGEFTLAANSEAPLFIPVELARPGSPAATDITDFNAAHKVLLDDGSSVNYTSNSTQAFPWLTLSNTVRA
ncbi:MAG: lamin tail domain-containing protein, partial [Nocardioides sp.]